MLKSVLPYILLHIYMFTNIAHISAEVFYLYTMVYFKCKGFVDVLYSIIEVEK